jgi:hypothetical protein
VWGATNPASDGSFTGWHLLGRWELQKPSGYVAGQSGTAAIGAITDADKEYFLNNQWYELSVTSESPDPFQEVSYLRFRTLTTIGTHGNGRTQDGVMISEIDWYGNVVEP